MTLPTNGKLAFGPKPAALSKAVATPAKVPGAVIVPSKARTAKVVAVPGRLVLMPERGFKPITPDGVVVPLNAFYLKALKNGDIAYASADAATPAAHAAAPAVAAPGFHSFVKPVAAAPATASAAAPAAVVAPAKA